MLRFVTASVLAALALGAMSASPAAADQDAQSIFATMAEKQAARWAGVENYAVEKHPEGASMGVPIYYEKVVEGDFVTFRQVPFNEWMKEETGGGMDAEGYEAMAQGYEMLVDAFVSQGDPMAPLVKPMMDDAAMMMRFTAEAERSGKAYADEIEGEYEAEGKRVPVTFSVAYEDYVRVGPLYEPRREVGRITGLMEAMATDPEKREELEELRRELVKAQQQMDEMEAQLSQMPAGARGMVEGQMQKARRVIGINEGPPTDWMPSPGG